jgi:DnaJ like chaperone protein
MTPLEWGVSGVCAIFGYWIVNAYLTGKELPPKISSDTDAKAPPADGPGGKAERWYEVLGVSESASREEIAAAYRRRISEYHPDKVSNLGDEIRAVAERKSQQINAAYESALRRFR